MKSNTNSWIALITFIACLWSPVSAWAEAQDAWAVLKEAYFAGKNIESNPEIIKISAPQRAESGAQVPFSFSLDHPMAPDHYVKSVYVLVDVNPVPLVGIFHFTPLSGKAEISTRIRLEADSYIHVIAETNQGKHYMNAIPVRASGGCGGTVDGNEKQVRAQAGQMKLSIDRSRHEMKRGKLLVKHPMYTGLQRDLVSQGFRPAFFINKAVLKYRGETVMDVDLGIGMSEDPHIQFNFIADKPGVLEVQLQDNEGGTFAKAVEVEG